MPDTVDIRKYNSELYIKREVEDQVQAWLANVGSKRKSRSKKRLLKISGPPGTGKTWLLHRLHEIFSASPKKIKTLWLDVASLAVSPPPHDINTGQIDPDLKRTWIRNLVNDLRSECPSIPPYDPVRDDAVIIEEIAKHICGQCYPDEMVCLFVDGGDELDEAGWREFERQVLEVFAREITLCFIIALREEILQVKSLALKRGGEALIDLKAFHSEVQGRQQLEKLVDHYSLPLSVEVFLEEVKPYGIKHPGINAFLFELKRTNKMPSIGSLALLEQLLGFLKISLPSQQTLIELVQISTLPDEWKSDDLQKLFNLSISEADSRREDLMSLSLVDYVDATQRYKIADGILEFVRAVNTPQGGQL